MGLLSRLFGTKPTFEDRVWRTQALKIDDLARQVASELSDDVVDSLVVYHFDETGDRLQSRLDEVGYERLNRPGTDALADLHSRVGSKIALLPSRDIPEEVKRGRDSKRYPSVGSKRVCHVHLAEHYPLPYRDDQVRNLHAILPPGSKFFCYVGLDESWFDFGRDKTLPLLEQMGMSDDEPLIHSMIGSAFRRVQEQLAGKHRGAEQPARSSKEWMELNIAG